MQIDIQIRKSAKREFVSEIIRLLHDHLNLQRSKKTLLVKTHVGFSKDNNGSLGAACWGRDTIEIALDSRLRPADIILTLTHEMIHVKQMATGKLSYRGTTPMWNGRDASHYSYANSPWEQQAYNGMFDLVTMVCDIFQKEEQ